ncbi:MAG: 50S ribosomal protein L16 [Fusobacteria bacterium]|nr:50S ribosomal protein L16 [Fusobacteriota bacterium]
MLMPKRTKYRKQMKGRIKGNATSGNYVAFGEFGLMAMEPHRITARQIETVRVVINRTFKRAGKVFIRIFPDKPITKKPLEVRMGKGKGNVEEWVAVVKPGRIMFEVSGITEELAKKALKKASYKLPIKVKFVKKEGGEN